MPISLPKIETPTYTLKVPSTEESIEYRPYLVSEEKILMLAMESKSTSEIFRSIKKIISKCTFEKMNVDQLTTFDVEYIFLNLRARSVGEIVNLNLKCEECGAKNEVEINLNEVQVIWPEGSKDNKFLLNEKIGVEMRWPRLQDTISVNPKNESDEMNEGLRIIAKCIKTIYDEDNVYSTDDYSDKEILSFIESLNHSQIEKIQNFLSNIPVVEAKVEFDCLNCRHHNEIVVRGLNNFF